MAIFESPDGGKTIYTRNIGETEKTLIQDSNSLFTFSDYMHISELAKTHESLRKALDHLLVLYYTIKDDEKLKT
jgi:hypothetical protein